MNAELVIAAWTGSAANYAAALLQAPSINSKIGITTAFANPTGGGGVPAATPAGLIGWTAGNSLIIADQYGPEPSTWSLGILGGALLLFAGRRKKPA